MDVLDHVLAPHVAEVDLERALAPEQRAVDRALAAQRAELGVDQRCRRGSRSIAALRCRVQVQHARLLADVDRLQQVDEAHVGERAGEARLARAAPLLEPGALLALQNEVHARDDLFDVDRLGQVVLDAELEAADLALHRQVARQEDERDVGPFRACADLFDEREPVDARQARVGEDQVGPRDIEHLERGLGVGAGRDVVAGLAQADFEHPQASRVGVDEQEVLLGHGIYCLSFAGAGPNAIPCWDTKRSDFMRRACLTLSVALAYGRHHENGRY